MLELSNVSKEILSAGARNAILHRIHLSVPKGDFLSIMGPSGSGKSTLLHILGMLDLPTSGEYVFAGQNVHGLSARQLAELRNRRIGFVFQSFMLIPRLSVRENAEVPLLYSRMHRKERKRRIDAALEQVGMSEKAKAAAYQLSGGQKQKAAIARAIIHDPDVLLADEPCGNLDAESKEDILRIFASLHQLGKTIVLVTHDAEVARVGERILTLKNGRWLGSAAGADDVRAHAYGTPDGRAHAGGEE